MLKLLIRGKKRGIKLKEKEFISPILTRLKQQQKRVAYSIYRMYVN